MDSKLRIVMLVGILFLVPAALTLYFITSDFATEPKLEPQAGGLIHGRVVDHDGKPLAGMEVRVETVRLQEIEISKCHIELSEDHRRACLCRFRLR